MNARARAWFLRATLAWLGGAAFVLAEACTTTQPGRDSSADTGTSEIEVEEAAEAGFDETDVSEDAQIDSVDAQADSQDAEAELIDADTSALDAEAGARAADAGTLDARADGEPDATTNAQVEAGVVCASNPDSGQLSASAIGNVDLLFMIDNSGSMSAEQRKLAAVLPNLVAALATGNRDGRPKTGLPSDFPPVRSLHIGVVSSDMGVNGAPSQNSCGDRSFLPTEHDSRTSTQRLNKPVGDDGILQIDTAVAVDGIWGPADDGTVTNFVAGDSACGSIAFPPNARFVDFGAGEDVAQAAQRFSCIAKRGRNGCGLEQQLESVLKALTPPDSSIKFTALSPNGHGNAINAGVVSGANQNFLRADSILIVVVVSDEEDCSTPDSSRAIFDASSTVPGTVNVRCGLSENASLLHDTVRYVAGLKALKSAAYQDRLIFAVAAGIPLAANTGAFVHGGAAAMDLLLQRADMQFMTQLNSAGTDYEPVPTCNSEAGDGSAAPGRRYLEVAKAFGDNGVVTSICEDQYQSLFGTLVDKVGAQLARVSCSVKTP